MERKAHEVGFLPTNCQGCHGGKLPKKLNAAGEWLVEQKKLHGDRHPEGSSLWFVAPKDPWP